MGNSGTKNQNCQFILKFDTKTILQNAVCATGITLFGQIWSKNQNCLFTLKFGT